MRRALRMLLVGLLISSLATGPVLAAPARALGTVAYADHAQLRMLPARDGATVFAGDQLATAPGGNLRVRVSTGQIYLLGDSVVSVYESSEGVGASLVRGTVGFSFAGPFAVVVAGSEVTVRPGSAQPAYGQVSLVSPKELLVSSYRGPLEVALDDEVHVVPEATSYRVVVDPQGPQGTGAGAAGGRRLMMLLIGVAIAGAIVTFVVLHNLSPSRP